MKTVYLVSDLEFNLLAFSTRDKARVYINKMAVENAMAWTTPSKPSKEDIALEKQAYDLKVLKVK